MKNLLITLVITILVQQGYSQDISNIILDTKSNLVISENSKSYLKNYLSSIDISLKEYLDYETRCEFGIALIERSGNDYILKITDCDKNVKGVASISGDIRLASEESIGKSLGKEIATIISGENMVQNADIGSESFINHHDSRYFFAPSAYNLKEGELYYNTNYFLLHDVQYGITDKFSLGMGTTIIGLPFYITPKISFPVSNKVNLAIGDLAVIGTYNTKFFYNLTYGVATIGTKTHNFSVGGGACLSTEYKGVRPVLNFSTMLSMSKYIYFIFENYFAQFPTELEAINRSGVTTGLLGIPTYPRETFSMERIYSTGMFGFRVVQKKKDVSSWQFGLVYFSGSNSNLPSKYDDGPYGWEVDLPNDNFIVIPAVSYTQKFGKNF